MSKDPSLYAVKVQSMTITLFVDHETEGGPPPEVARDHADELAHRLLMTVQRFGEEYPRTLIAVTP